MEGARLKLLASANEGLMAMKKMKAIENKDSTKDQSTVEPQRVQEVISKFLAERFGLSAPEWPSKK